MATFAARRLQPMLQTRRASSASSCSPRRRAIEFLRPLRSSSALEARAAPVRDVCAAMPTDRYLAPDIEAMQALVASGEIGRASELAIPELQAVHLA